MDDEDEIICTSCKWIVASWFSHDPDCGVEGCDHDPRCSFCVMDEIRLFNKVNLEVN